MTDQTFGYCEDEWRVLNARSAHAAALTDFKAAYDSRGVPPRNIPYLRDLQRFATRELHARRVELDRATARLDEACRLGRATRRVLE